MTATQFDDFYNSANGLFQIILEQGSLLNADLLVDTEEGRLRSVFKRLSDCHLDLTFLLALLQRRLDREGVFDNE